MIDNRETPTLAAAAEQQRTGPSSTAAPATAASDAIGDLLGVRAEAAPRGRLRRALRWAPLVLPLLGLVAAGSLWLYYQACHVSSRNAAVRGRVAEIGSRLNGIVAAVAVDIGDRVAAGQILVQFEDRHLLANVQEAQAAAEGLERSIEVEQAAIEIDTREVKERRADSAAIVAAAEAQTETARIMVEDGRRLHELQKALHEQGGAVASSRVSDAEFVLRGAEARLQEARANAVVTARTIEKDIRSMEAALTLRRHRRTVLEAELRGARARLARAEVDANSASIRAPEDGAILRRIVQPGSSVDVGQPVVAIWLGRELWVEAWIDEEELGSVRVGNAATVTFHLLPDQEFAGAVEAIGLSTDLELPETDVPQPRFARMRGAPVVGVRIRLHEQPPDLVPGLSAVVAISRDAAVPAAAPPHADVKKE